MEEQNTIPQGIRRRAILVTLKMVGLLILVGYVLSRLNLKEVTTSWRGTSAMAIFAMLSCFTASMILRIAKWGWLAGRIGFVFGWFDLCRSYLSGLLLGLVTPLRVGEVYRTAALSLPPDSEASKHGLATMAWLLERVYELLVLLLLVALSMVILFPKAHAAPLFVLVGVGLLLLVAPIPVPAWLEQRLPHWLNHHIISPMLQARDALGLIGCIALLLMTTCTFALNLLGGWLIYQLFGQLQVWDYLLRMPILILINNVPITIAGVGLRELGSMELFGPLAYPASAAAVAATLLFIGVNIAAFIAVLPLELIHYLKRTNHPSHDKTQ